MYNQLIEACNKEKDNNSTLLVSDNWTMVWMLCFNFWCLDSLDTPARLLRLIT